MSADVLLGRLPAVVALGRDHWRADCPACGDTLRVRRLGGALIVACSGGCLPRRVVAAVGLDLRVLWPDVLALAGFAVALRVVAYGLFTKRPGA